MTTSTQQIPSNPALDFANSILEVTNNGLELIEILRDIANDCDEKATTNDRIAAANILTDRAFGKCPKQVSPSPGPNPRSRRQRRSGTLREALSAVSQNGPESPRLVTQIDDALHDSLGTRSQRPHSATSFPCKRESRIVRRLRFSRIQDTRPLRPLLNPFHYPTAHSRHHQQRPDAPRRPAGNRQDGRRPGGLS